MPPVTKVDGRVVVRTNCEAPTPYLRAMRPLVEAVAITARKAGRRPSALDVGCGNGRNSEWLKRQGYDVSSLDWKPDYGVKFDIRKGVLPASSGTVDIVLFQYVLMFVEWAEAEQIARAAIEALSPIGFVVVELFNAKDSMTPTVEQVRGLRDALEVVFKGGGLDVYRTGSRFVAKRPLDF